ncbi:aminotransferase class IV [Halovivax gelatinilyticus]|uniref:aminotransferase class IV n=1 Tax=Halovivax gelatinilyticus TaxID=2961597 RepID=UPI0020CA61B1|nr:aminotransferase class IV [Halovivax gelatinilyticus]
MTDPSDAPERVYYVNGALVPASEARVSVDDRGFRYGDGAFETLRAYGGSIFEWDAHADRLEATCETLGFEPGLTREALRARIDETLSANDLADAYVRLSVTRGVQPGTLSPDPDVEPTVVIWTKPLARGGTRGRRVWDEPATVRTVETRRIPDDAIPAAAKTHNYLNGILARTELRGTDADEAILLDHEGRLAEGATSNLFVVDDGVLHTPSTEGPVLPGITRRVVLELADRRGIPTAQGRYEPTVLTDADEVFLTNTTWEVRPVVQVDDARFDVGPVTRTLQRSFDERVEREHY